MCKACHGCIRILMMVFNFIFVLCGLGLFAIGLYFYLGSFFKNMGNEGTSMVIMFYVTMGIGTFTLIVGACGCCGAYHESPCLLGTYFVLLLIIFSAEIAGGVLYEFKYSKEVQESLGKAFDKGVDELKEKGPIKDHWMDEAQKMLKCCGSKGFKDYGAKTPSSCCIDNKCPSDGQDTEKIYKPGCKTAWEDFVKNWWMVFAGVLLGIAVIELLGLIFSMCLCCSARNMEYDMVETRA